MLWIYLSPHPDDVALSCGGLVWEQVQCGEKVEIWTICSGDPPGSPFSPFAESLHLRWGATAAESASTRRKEDRESARALGAEIYFFDLPDCIYRTGDAPDQHLYASEESLFGPLHPWETNKIAELALAFEARLAAAGKAYNLSASLVCPLAIGNHVDHQLVRAAAEQVSSEYLAKPKLYYADYPYILKETQKIEELESAGWNERICPVSEKGLQAWQEAVAAHTTQISSFWESLPEMRAAIQAYRDLNDGIRLWYLD